MASLRVLEGMPTVVARRAVVHTRHLCYSWRMICGNDPRARLTPGDRAAIEWFREWLAWNATPEDERGPEPVPSDWMKIERP